VSQQSEQSERAREREREKREQQREAGSASSRAHKQSRGSREREREGEERAFSTSPTPPRDPNHCLPAPPCHTLPYRPFTVPPRPHSRAHARLYPPVLPHHVVLPHHRRVCKTTALHATRTATARRTTIATTAQCAWVACVWGVCVATRVTGYHGSFFRVPTRPPHSSGDIESRQKFWPKFSTPCTPDSFPVSNLSAAGFFFSPPPFFFRPAATKILAAPCTVMRGFGACACTRVRVRARACGA
jgi:hypothetical protein